MKTLLAHTKLLGST